MGEQYFFTPIEAVDFLKRRGCTYHHSATVQGYLARNKSYIEEYDGRYGKGYVVHIPTKLSVEGKTTRYHGVEYWLTAPDTGAENNQ